MKLLRQIFTNWTLKSCLSESRDGSLARPVVRALVVCGLFFGSLVVSGCHRPAPEGTRVDGQPQGTWTYFHSSGEKEKSGDYQAGARQGVWTFWYPNGQRKQSGSFDGDVQTGKWTFWHQNGQKAKQGTYRDGVEDGHWVFWHPNGQRAAEGDFHQGERYGLWRQWDNTGVARRHLYTDGMPEEYKKLLAGLASPDQKERQQAAQKLLARKEKAVPALAKALKTPETQIQAAEILANLGRAAGPAAEALIAVLGERDPEARQAAVAAMKAIGPDALEVLQPNLRHPDPLVRALMTEVLGAMPQKAASGALSSLHSLAHDAHPTVAQAATKAMTHYGEQAVSELVECYQSSAMVHREHAILALGTLARDVEAARQVLLNSLPTAEGVTAQHLAAAFGQTESVCVDQLLAGLFSSEKTTRRNASNSLRQIGKPAIPKLVQALYHRRADVRWLAAETLGKMGSVAAEAIPELQRRIRREPDGEVRRYFEDALKAIQ